jgi:hypothetical protein
MKKTKRPNKPRPDVVKLPIVYHDALEQAYDGWAAEIGEKPLRLRQLTERAIRTRHDEAQIRHGICELQLNSCVVYFSIEADAVLVRGYGWDIPREPLDDLDGGGFWS